MSLRRWCGIRKCKETHAPALVELQLLYQGPVHLTGFDMRVSAPGTGVRLLLTMTWPNRNVL